MSLLRRIHPVQILLIVAVVLCLAGYRACGKIRLRKSEKKPQTVEEIQAATGKPAPLLAYVRQGTRQGCMAGAGIALVLLAGSRWWLRGAAGGVQVQMPPAETGGLRPVVFWGVLGAILAGSAALRWQRMDLSLWGDEAWAFQENILGDWKPAAKGGDMQGEIAFEPATWTQTLFSDKFGGNHYLFSVLERLCVTAWRGATGAPDWDFCEQAIRVVPFAAGLASLAALALWLRRMGWSATGLIAAGALSLHPWHLRYSSEGRGYSLMLLFLVLTLWALTVALQRGRLRWWLVFALCQFLCLISWKGSVYALGPVNAGLALWLFLRRGRDAAALPALRRLIAAGLMGCIFLLPLTAAQQMQIRDALPALRNRNKGMDLDWFRNVVAETLSGVPWHSISSRQSGVMAWDRMLHSGSAAVLMIAGGAALLFLWGSGARRLRREFPLLGLICLCMAGGAILSMLHFRQIMKVELLPWYLFYLTLPLAVLAAFGAAPLLRASGARRGLAAGVMAGLAGLAVFSLRPMLHEPQENFRGSWLASRARHEPRGYAGPSKVVTIHYARFADAYDPRANPHVHSVAQMEPLMNKAKATGGEFYVVLGNRPYVQGVTPDVVAMLEDPARFELVADLPVQNDLHSHAVFRMRKD